MLRCRVPAGYYRAEGMIKNVNTIEEYREIDKMSLLQLAGKTVSCPSALHGPVMITNFGRYGMPSTTARYTRALLFWLHLLFSPMQT